MHACELALDLGIRSIVLPRNPGLLCAWGALGAPLGREYSITVRETAPELRRLLARAQPMAARARAELIAHGTKPAAIKTELRADVRYRGQSYEIEVALGPRFVNDFHQAHRRTFGYAAPEAPIEVVNLRLRASAAGPSIAPRRIPRTKSKPAPTSKLSVIVGGARRSVPVYARDEIGAGAKFNGPAIVVELSATAYVSPEFTLHCDDFGNLHLETR
jgi:N-methylhydantoinase A